MNLRYVACLIPLLSLSLHSACRGKSDVDAEQAEELLSVSEEEPNQTREQCSRLVADKSLVGAVSGTDKDVVCPDQVPALRVRADQGVAIALEHPAGHRVELGMGKGHEVSMPIYLPSQDWVVEFRGQGRWELDHPSEELRAEPYCGIRLGTSPSPVVLGFQRLPAEFPLCAQANLGSAQIQFAAIRPDQVAGFEMRVDGLDASMEGAMRVLDGQESIAHTPLEPGQRLPGIRWLPQSELTATLQINKSGEPKTVVLRIEAIAPPTNAEQVLELEPNDTETTAVPIYRPSVVAGALFHAQDIDRFRLIEDVDDLQIEVVAQEQTRLRVTSSSVHGTQDAVHGLDGVYRICALQRDETTPVDVRVAYADDSQASDGIYELRFKPLKMGTDEKTLPIDDTADPAAQRPIPDFGFTRPLRPGKDQLIGQIFPADDVDLWEFRVPEGYGDLRVMIHVEALSAMDVKARILDADLVPVAQVDRGAAGQDERIEIELPSGEYYLELRATGVVDCDAYYALRIQSPQWDTRPWAHAEEGDTPQVIQRLPDDYESPQPPSLEYQMDTNTPKPPNVAPSNDEDVAPAYPW